jgi:hypothetical protein
MSSLAALRSTGGKVLIGACTGRSGVASRNFGSLKAASGTA